MSKFDAPANPNYAATVIRVKTLVALENCDNLVGMPLFGLQAIVGKDTNEGDMGIVFPAECQLSMEFTAGNNLHRHADLNADKDKAGYLEDNRRVRAIKLRGHRSDALYMPLASLVAAGVKGDVVKGLKEGDTFDVLDGVPICTKYVIRRKISGPRGAQPRAEKRVDEKMFPEHMDSTHWLRVDRTVEDWQTLIVTQKLHGTSIRVGNVPVKRRLSLLERIARRLGVKVQDTEFAMVYGSRKVIKDANNPRQNHFYDSDLWTLEGKKLDGLIPQNYIVYAEIVGYTEGGAPIQTHYTYDCLPGTRKLYVYRVCFVNAQGTICDLSWDAVMEFCHSVGLNHVPELWRNTKDKFAPDIWLDTKFFEGDDPTALVQCQYPQAVPLSPDSPCDEGVCIRIEGMIPEIYKHKSPIFLGHETAMLDKEVADIEAEQEEAVLAEA